ncbi:MAG: GDP-mannose 4,6-dehydratase [Candidatus Dojkabacteria bacterium]
MRTILITGSAGFIGTNLTRRFLDSGNRVIGIDNFSSSSQKKVNLFRDNTNYEFIEHNIVEDILPALSNSRMLKDENTIDEIYNLACPASPKIYINLSIETIKANVDGMFNILEVAKKYNSKFLHSSTSEVYGDPLENPQKESYRGNVNTVGPRSCYDEAKRISETICYEYKRLYGLDIKICRIFNTYGPYMDVKDGRVITNFIVLALQGKDLPLFDGGNQTRSFQYVDDLLNAFEKFMATDSDFMGPVNLGNENEFTVKELGEIVLKKIKTSSKLVNEDQEEGSPYQAKHDPQVRRPDITLAREKLDWEPKVQLDEGLDKTIEYFRGELSM